MSAHTSATFKTPSGSHVHLVGVSHTSPFYGKLAQAAIEEIQPKAVVLEVDEGRLREQADRGLLWRNNNTLAVVEHALQPFLQHNFLWERLTGQSCPRQAYALQNEGSAVVEGGIYGSEVILACSAAQACGSTIFAADRNKRLSDERLKAAKEEAYFQMLTRMPEDDWALVRSAAAVAARDVAGAAFAVLAPLVTCDAEAFAEQLHPIFLLASGPQHDSVLQRLGCSQPGQVREALQRMITRGTNVAGQVHEADIALVRDCIGRIEQQKHNARRHAFAAAPYSPSPALHCRQQLATAGACCALDTMQRPDRGAAGGGVLQDLSQRLGRSLGVLPARALSTHAGDTAQLPSALQAFAGWAWGTTDDARRDVLMRWCHRGAELSHSALHFSSHATLDTTISGHGAGDDARAHCDTVVAERDSVLAHRIWSVANEAAGQSVVAVVGANHIPGILRIWCEGAGSACEVAKVQQFLQPPVRRSAEERQTVAWKACTVERLALGMEAAAAGGVGAALYASRRLCGPALAPAAMLALSGAMVASAACAAQRQGRIAQLVHNVVLQDAA